MQPTEMEPTEMEPTEMEPTNMESIASAPNIAPAQSTAQRCTTCGLPATARCGGCASHESPDKIPYYCSKTCHKADWITHKPACKAALFYARIRHFEMTNACRDQDFWHTAKQVGITDRDFLVNMGNYLTRTSPATRTRFMSGSCRVSQDFADAMRRIHKSKEYKEYYEGKWAVRVPKEFRDKCRTPFEYEVPFDMRPIVRHRKRTRLVAEIQMFPQDYELLSFEGYMAMFGDGKTMGNDPFVREQISLGGVRIATMSRGWMKRI